MYAFMYALTCIEYLRTMQIIIRKCIYLNNENAHAQCLHAAQYSYIENIIRGKKYE